MTTALLIILVLLGIPTGLALLNRPGLIGQAWRQLVANPSVDEVRASVEEQDELFRHARASFERAGKPSKKGAADPIDPAASADVAALNVFVERSQIQLRKRVLWCGIGIAVLLLLDAAVAAVALDWLTAGPQAGTSWVEVVRWSIQTLVLAAVSVGLVLLFTTLARGLFHEASKALEKRHALGFGRLYVQMKVLGAQDARRATRSLNETELLRAFGWNPPIAPPAAAKDAGERSYVLPAPPAASVRTLRGKRNGAAEPDAPGPA